MKDQNNPNIEIFRKSLEDLRVKNGIKGWPEMAAIVGVSVSEMYNLKNGTRTPSFKTAGVIAAMFSVPIAFLYLNPLDLMEGGVKSAMLDASFVSNGVKFENQEPAQDSMSN